MVLSIMWEGNELHLRVAVKVERSLRKPNLVVLILKSLSLCRYVAMGSPLAPILANLFMGFHEEQ